MSTITDLHPRIVWTYFSEILSIPRPSGKEEQILNYLKQFANEHKLDYEQDDTGNVLIRKSASHGREQAPGVLLQSHVDMVCEKNSDSQHDFEKQGIQAYVDEGWVKARGTTLGADNGIGVAAQLAVLASEDLEHGPLECLFTVDEETGLTGAFGLSPSLLKGSILLNLDSEDDGEIFIGCAGGVDTLIEIPVNPESTGNAYKQFIIEVRGLMGGHSGDDINKGRGNANKILARVLFRILREIPFRLAEITGGNLRNAIPREAKAHMIVPEAQAVKLAPLVKELSDEIREELKHDPGIEILLRKPGFKAEKAMPSADTHDLIRALHVCPNGVVAMSQEIEGLVETSTNLASIRTQSGLSGLDIVTSQRSSVASAKNDIASRIAALFSMCGGTITHSDAYPGWSPNPESKILQVAERTWKELFGASPKVKAIHAGLECGLFLEKYPQLDMISFGPTIRGAHSPDERLEIHTVEKFWKFLVTLLDRSSR